MVGADACRQKGVASSAELDPENASRAVTEYDEIPRVVRQREAGKREGG
jgi:hypothetical protein